MDEKKLTENEYNELIEYYTQFDSLKIQLGEVYIQRHKLKKMESELMNRYDIIEKSISELEKKLSFKYGNISIDINTGNFTPN
jgi:hypothetical protein